MIPLPAPTPRRPKHERSALPDNVRATLAARIQHAVRRTGRQTWADVAREIGLTEHQIRGYRNGTSVPSLDALYLLCQATGFTFNWFLGMVPLDGEGVDAQGPRDFNGR